MLGMKALEKMLTVTDDDSDTEEITDIVSSQWVSCGKYMLTIGDKIIVKSGGKFTDNHNQIAKYLIKCQFPI